MPSYCVKALENTQSILCGLFLCLRAFLLRQNCFASDSLDFSRDFCSFDAGGLSPAKEKRAKSTEKTGCPTCGPLLIDACLSQKRKKECVIAMTSGKKPVLRGILLIVIVCGIAAVCLLTRTKPERYTFRIIIPAGTQERFVYPRKSFVRQNIRSEYGSTAGWRTRKSF